MSAIPRTRTVLADCRYVLSELRQNPREEAWRVLWCAPLTLLRAVGDVLKHEANSGRANVQMDAERGNRLIAQGARRAYLWADELHPRGDHVMVSIDRHARLR